MPKRTDIVSVLVASPAVENGARRLLPSSAACLSLALLTGCDAIDNLFSNKDWREGTEEIADCIERVRAGYHEGVVKLLDSQEKRKPTFTFDVTKAGFEDIEELTILDQGEEKGSVIVSGFGAPPYRLRRFLNMPVDEKGAFFMGVDPSYYRVQGEPIALKDVFTEGCDRQRPGMRFLSFTFKNPDAPNDADGEPVPDDENNS